MNKIYVATGFLFLEKSERLSILIPKNLREFIHFYKFINELRDSNKENNQRNFKSYFLNVWSFNNLNKKQNDILIDLNENDVSIKNKSLIHDLKIYYEANEIDRTKIKDIENSDNNSLNISIGDVLFVLNHYNRNLSSIQEKRFHFAIKTYYTIILTQMFESDLNKAEILVGTNIYSKGVSVVQNSIRNDFWSFELNNISSVEENIESNIVDRLIYEFIISKKKDMNRTQDNVIYQYEPIRDGIKGVFSILGFIRNLFFTKKGDKFEELLPKFSIDLIEAIIYDLKRNKYKGKYSDNYGVIITKHIIIRIINILKNIDEQLHQNFIKHPFIISLLNSSNEFEQKLNYLKNSNDLQIVENVENFIKDLKNQSEDLRIIAEDSYENYENKYFHGDNFSTQGVKQGMNNLIKDFDDYPMIKKELNKYRKLMDRDLKKGIFGIKYLLTSIMKNG